MKKLNKKMLILIAVFGSFILFNTVLSYSKIPQKYKNGVCHVEVDYSIGSGKPRFFVYENDKCVSKSLCAHGKGPGNTASKPKFSNEIGSGCSSLGTFKIVGRSVMSNGYPCLVLKGLDSTNSNAYARHIYVHPSKLVDFCKYGIAPFYLPLTEASRGCFAISTECFDTLDSLYKVHKNIKIYAYR
jgi:hypothetical protein